MKPTITVRNDDGIAELEALLERLGSSVRKSRIVLKAATPPVAPFLRDLWLALVVAAGIGATEAFTLLSPGISDWPDLLADDFDNDETPALSLAYLLALQLDGTVVPDGDAHRRLSVDAVRRHVAERRGGLIGTGGRMQRMVEFDPQESIAAVLGRRDDRARAFEQLVLSMMRRFEVGAVARGMTDAATPTGFRGDLIDFLRELHTNGYAYARASHGIRALGFRKHLQPKEAALARAVGFPRLHDYVSAQAPGRLNLVEGSVSDFGPGILEGFRASEAGSAFTDWPDDKLMDKLLHEQLSGNPNDPNAGLGTVIALKAARNMHAFVTLRTGRHWYTLAAGQPGEDRMTAVPGNHPSVRGTHWVILYPDSVGS